MTGARSLLPHGEEMHSDTGLLKFSAVHDKDMTYGFKALQLSEPV